MQPDNYITIANAVLLRKEMGKPLSRATISLRAKEGKIDSIVRYGRRLVDKTAVLAYEGKPGNPNPSGRPVGVKESKPRDIRKRRGKNKSRIE